MRLRKLFSFKKCRRYPIQRDREGRSLRCRCFLLFEQGKRPAEVAKGLVIKEPTVQRYFRDWKRLGPSFEKMYAFVKELFKKGTSEREKNIELFARMLGISNEEFEAILSRPHGLRQLLSGKLYFPVQADVDHKRHRALELALLILDHLVKHRGTFEDVYYAFRRWMKENMQYREEEDAEIEAENQIMPLVHKILAVEMDNERKGRVKPDTLSEEERQTLMKLEMEKLMKETEIAYWNRLFRLMAEGLTQEQARQKIYQDLLDKGNLKGAKLMREFQDKVHPLKAGDQLPPSTPPQPSSAP